MKLLSISPILFAIANAMIIRKDNNGYNMESKSPKPSSTLAKPTKTNLYKRSKTTEFYDIQNITIFEEGMTEWNSDWVESSWSISDDPNKIKDGVIQVELSNNAGFSLQSKTLESTYGYLMFDFKLSATDGKTYLNFISFDDSYVNQGKYLYTGNDYMSINQEIKNHSKNTFISRINRFAWQNWENNSTFTLYLRKIVYRDIGIEIRKYDQPIDVLDTNSCELNTQWVDLSEGVETTYERNSNDECVMKVKVSASGDSVMFYQLQNRKFTGGKLQMTIKSSVDDSLFIWNSKNTDDEEVENFEVTLFTIGKEFQNINDEDFDTEIEYNSLIFNSMIAEDVEYEITEFKFYPISVDENVPLFDVTPITEPDVIVDENGFYWLDASWGATQCEFQVVKGAMECAFEGKTNAWPGYAFFTENRYNGGTLYINMKVLNPDQNINILAYQINEQYNFVLTFRATTEYADYTFELPTFTDFPTYKYVLQEASQKSNIYYIKKMAYYPPDMPLPGEENNEVPTTTESSQPTPTPIEKSEEQIYQDKGYDGCSPNVKISYANKDGMWGVENGQWCAILEKNIDKCWSALYGHPCCTSNATDLENDTTGAWGMENGEICGKTGNNICWAEGYSCCKRSESDIVLVDEAGAWGVKDGKWCGIV